VPGVGLIPGLLGDAPLADAPPLLLWLFPLVGLPAVDGFELDDPELVVLDVPSLAVEGLLAPGKVPQGEPLGVLEVLGTVDGWVVLPVGLDPGAV